MGRKVAKLVSVILMTRVIVDEDASDENIMSHADTNFIEKIKNNETLENIEFIQDDTEVPFNMNDAVKIALNELKYATVEGDVKSIIQNRAVELLGESFTDDEFENAWTLLH